MTDGAHDFDDLDWAPSGEPATTLSEELLDLLATHVAVEPLPDGISTGTARSTPVTKLQVQLDSGWTDYDPKDTAIVFENMSKGVLEFEIKSHGKTYSMDMRPDGPPKQTNAKTRKARPLRILRQAPLPPSRTLSSIGSDADDDDTADGAAADPLAAPAAPDDKAHKSWPDGFLEEQKRFGAQSDRGGPSQHPLQALKDNTHAVQCFEYFKRNEEKMCEQWAVFYHSYSFAALIYEVHAAVGAVLLRFRSRYASLPRLIMHEFKATPDAETLIAKFNAEWAKGVRDHHPDFRKVGLSVMCSLVATGPEASPPGVFVAGYSCRDVSFRGVLENVLQSCFVPKDKVKCLADDIIALSEKHGLDVSQFGGKRAASGLAGHLLQIFIKRHKVDELAYAALPFGPVDESRMPLSKWLDSDASKQYGQARVVCHPKFFMRSNTVHMHVTSADPTFHKNRATFQEELTNLLDVILAEPSLRKAAATGIYGGQLPSWWSADDQRRRSKARSRCRT
eukprot:gnl/TRDRNA2_/TRDRNA2_168662_c0_seq1.p1 gnl/TRDRNA2_/TRDRNA2_168662_c0~~gnl/TRDRNA2_/TRDRNA2_168662_c0_seq1.p1  ORF type:complete len:519 (-),score=90.80 gnl/TRDRNA2_/TRDRNA2_168662_c0_seq1:223-1743(-)